MNELLTDQDSSDKYRNSLKEAYAQLYKIANDYNIKLEDENGVNILFNFDLNDIHNMKNKEYQILIYKFDKRYRSHLFDIVTAYVSRSIIVLIILLLPFTISYYWQLWSFYVYYFVSCMVVYFAFSPFRTVEKEIISNIKNAKYIREELHSIWKGKS